ncbi:tetratricopeptide repeat protein [Chryseobacterium salivictor]|uniref:Beta-barrel assembly-enhancing protease n=1 Tax=Chryseobacterium salivictor TaxID=2547600 RepID=A0A4P6ZF00_9FLAO|nr:tetratricopeptide repeat protein [Chryseobacterium salivictor]QBO58097.1 Beta-barrel assembly-enhancing protease [Chryseobacterium salivictor]
MKTNFSILFIFLSVSVCFGQSRREIKRQGLAAFNNEDFMTAKVNYLKLLEKGEKTWETYTILGDCEFQTGNPDEALSYYGKAQEKNPVYLGLYLRIGTVLRQQKKFDEAIMSFRKMTVTNPKSPQVYNIIASTYYEKGDYKETLDEINTMVQMVGENLDSSFGRSMSYIKLNQIPEACVELEKADRFDTENQNKEIDVMKAQFCSK